MSLKKNIIAGLLVSVIVGVGIGASVSAVKIGGTDINEKVTSVSCRDGSDPAPVVICDLVTASGTKTVTFDTSESASQRKASIERELVESSLMDATSTTPSTNPDTVGQGTNEDPDPVTERCTSILPAEWCTEDGNGIAGILNLVLNIMTMGIGILATIGLVISGIQWLTARDKEDQIVKAKSRIFNIVIGIVIWGIMWLVLQWLLPGGINLEVGP